MDDVDIVREGIGSTWTSDEDTNKRGYRESIAALARIEARLAEVEKERDKAVEAQDWLANDAAEFNIRAEAAEARVAVLEGALRAWPDDGSVHEDGCSALIEDAGFDCDCFTSIARAALAATEEKRA